METRCHDHKMSHIIRTKRDGSKLIKATDDDGILYRKPLVNRLIVFQTAPIWKSFDRSLLVHQSNDIVEKSLNHQYRKFIDQDITSREIRFRIVYPQ
jgi:hypothetical protein